ncbi:MAG: protein kinase domain-containing protein [Thermodesulfobacteriota bacterium]
MLTHIGPYRVANLLCETKLSRIYRVWDTRYNRPAVLKLARETATNPGGSAATLKKEADILSRLVHPGIVSLYDQGEVDQRPYMVTELVEGHSLAVERDLDPDWRRILEIVTAVAEALSFLHGNRILHLDVKAENIMVSNRGGPPAPRLFDFGMSLVMGKDAPPLPPHKRIGGTAAYMAPEHALGRALDGRTDLYSLGVVLFELATGEKPFYGPTPAATAMMHVQTPPPRPGQLNPDIPPALEAAILKALAKDPNHRFLNMGEFINDLRSVETGLQSRNPPSPAPAGDVPDLDLAGRLLRTGRPDQADAICRVALRQGISSYQCHYLMGTALLKRSRFQRAMRHFQSAIALNEKAADAHNGMGLVLAAIGQNEHAAAAFENAVHHAPGHLSALLNLGRQHEKLGRPEAAETCFQKVFDLNPGATAALNGLAHVKQVLGKTAEAMALYEKAVALAPDRPEPHYNLAAVHFTRRETAAARKSLAAALALKPGFPAAHHMMGKILLDENKAGEAIHHLEAALADDPRVFLPLYDLGRACRMRNDLKGAAAAYKRYLQFAARDAVAYMALAEVLEAMGDKDNALKYQNIASDITRSTPRADKSDNLFA